MRLALRWRGLQKPGPAAPACVVEVVTPRTNLATLSSAENLFAAVALAEPFSLEIAADHSRRQFLLRAPNASVGHLESQLSVAYPQTEFRPLEPERDPARCQADEQVGCCALQLRAASYLPIRTFTDLEVDGERTAQADPVLGILSALGDLPAGWRGLSQLVLKPAPEDWCREYLRLTVQHPLEHERVSRGAGTGGPMLAFVSVALGLCALGLQSVIWYRAGYWLQLVCMLVVALVALGVGIPALRRRLRPSVYDMDLVRDKVSRVAYLAELRLSIFAPAAASRAELEVQLERVAAAYRRYSLAAANSFAARRMAADPADLCTPVPVGPPGKLPILTALELAGVWHLPHAAADVALLERTTARRWVPLPPRVVDGCQIGVSAQQGHHVPVSVPADVLSRHLLLVAKTRRGKSTLLLRLAQHTMQPRDRQAVLLVDPHRDLAVQALEQVPRDRASDVVFLDVADRHRPFGLNLLDAGLGWDRDRAVANTLQIFQREWGDRFWGPRMEDAFRFALLSLFEANEALYVADPVFGRAAQYTLLEVPAIFSDPGFRREVLGGVTDLSVRTWWSEYFDPLERRLKQEVINPVLSKIHRFEGSRAARYIVGQPASTIDPSAWLREASIVIVNTGRGIVGDNAAALIGSTLVNLVALGVGDQARLEPRARGRISIFVDEFHTIPGADYEAILGELSKYGANLVLATQSLARLLALGQEEGRGLRATVFANLDGLFAFNCSAEDAEYLVPELGGALHEQDLVELDEHQCYARLTTGGRRLPTFSVNLDPPLSGDAEYGAGLARASAERFGRAVELVEEDRRSAQARVLGARAKVDATPTIPTSPAQAPPAPRNVHRARKKRRSSRQEGAANAALTSEH